MGNINAWKEKRDREDAEEKARQMAKEYDIFVPKPGDTVTESNMPKQFPTMGWFQVWKFNLTNKQRNQIPDFKFHIGTGPNLSLRERAQLPFTSHERGPITQQEAEEWAIPFLKDTVQKGYEMGTGKKKGGFVQDHCSVHADKHHRIAHHRKFI